MLHFLAGTWVIWLCVAEAAAIMVIVLMIGKMSKEWRSHDFNRPLFASFLPSFIMGILASVSTVLFIIGVVASFLKL
jgi:hypothetical protein